MRGEMTFKIIQEISIIHIPFLQRDTECGTIMKY